MKIVADTHLHLYPCYDLGITLAGLMRRLRGLEGGAGALMAFLAEKPDCHFFSDLRTGRIKPGPGLEVCPSGESDAIVMKSGGGESLYLFSGRQIVSAERIEALALTTDTAIPNGLPLSDTVSRIADSGGVPVLSWAPGKWFFNRGDVVAGLIRRTSPRQMLLGDSTLRPMLWPEPAITRMAMELGYRVVAGSDPLPFSGEGKLAGCYATSFDADVDLAKPVTSIKALFRSEAFNPRRIGRRNLPVQLAIRLFRNVLAKRKAQ